MSSMHLSIILIDILYPSINIEIDGPIIKISSIFICDESELYLADKVSKVIPSPFKVSVRPFKSASDYIFALTKQY